MNIFEDKLVIFGGAGTYMNTIKMRLSFNDMFLFNTKKEKWSRVQEVGQVPKKRMGHVAAVMGGVYLVHGGFNTEGKIVLDDFNLYDFENKSWMPVVTSAHGVVFEQNAQYGSLGDVYHKKLNSDLIGPRHCHSMVAVYDAAYYKKEFKNTVRSKQRRAMWITERLWDKDDMK